MLKELTIDQAKKSPAAFMYVFATDEFLARISKKYAKIIRVKRANEVKLLKLSAKKYLKDFNRYTEYVSAIKTAFINMYGMRPIDALVILAQGGTVAGKNWEKGVFGIGATRNNTTFNGVEVSGNSVTVDPSNGHILCGGKDITATGDTVYSNVNGTAKAYQLFGRTDSGMTFQSQYNKATGKYYAYAFRDEAMGETISASDNRVLSGADGADVWGNIVLLVEQFIEWLINLFGNGRETLSAENTLPSQSADGFTYSKNSTSEASLILVALLAGGTLLATSGKGKSGKNKK